MNARETMRQSAAQEAERTSARIESQEQEQLRLWLEDRTAQIEQNCRKMLRSEIESATQRLELGVTSSLNGLANKLRSDNLEETAAQLVEPVTKMGELIATLERVSQRADEKLGDLQFRSGQMLKLIQVQEQLRSAGEEGGDHVEEAGLGDAGRRRHAPEHLGETLEGDTAEPQRDDYTDNLPGYSPARMGLPADVVDDRGEQLLETPYLRHEGGGEGASDSTPQSQAAPLSRAAEQHQNVGGQQHEPEHRASGESADSTLDRLFKLIDKAQKPVHEREQQEAALLQDEADAAREAAEKAALQEQQTHTAESAHELTLRAANFKVDLQVCQVLKVDGVEGLHSPETIDQLRLTVEQALGEYGEQLSGIGLTRDNLTEQLSRYVAEISGNLEPFLSRMEASDFHRSSEQELSDIQEDAQMRDSDDYEPSR
jgi:hypothetical protein